MPSTSLKNLNVDRQLILQPDALAVDLQISDAVAQFQRQFLEKSGLILEFPKETLTWIRDHISTEFSDLPKNLAEMFANYEYGMKLAGVQNLRITIEVVSAPDKYLDNMIKQSYDSKHHSA